ncbi:MAG: hypothetical protein R3D59_11165 [Paracoccaceae bacterium]
MKERWFGAHSEVEVLHCRLSPTICPSTRSGHFTGDDLVADLDAGGYHHAVADLGTEGHGDGGDAALGPLDPPQLRACIGVNHRHPGHGDERRAFGGEGRGDQAADAKSSGGASSRSRSRRVPRLVSVTGSAWQYCGGDQRPVWPCRRTSNPASAGKRPAKASGVDHRLAPHPGRPVRPAFRR